MASPLYTKDIPNDDNISTVLNDYVGPPATPTTHNSYFEPDNVRTPPTPTTPFSMERDDLSADTDDFSATTWGTLSLIVLDHA
jgi:hypothetical protein